MKYLMIIVLCAIIGFISDSAVARGLSHTVTPHGGLALPMGQFRQNSEEVNSGYAQVGFGGGVDYDLRFGTSGLCWSSGFTWMANDFEAEYFHHGLDVILQESGSYSNYIFLTGLKYEIEFSDNLRLFAVAQGGGALSKGPYFNGYVDVEGDDLPYVEYQMGNDSSTGFAIGLGMVTNETTTVIIRFYSLSSLNYRAIAEYTQNSITQKADVGWSQPVSIISLTVGYAIDLGR